MILLADSINWLWDNPVTREVARYPNVVGKLFWPNESTPALASEASKKIVTKIVEVLPPDMMIVPSSARMFVRMAGVSGACAVAMGAYGAHVFYQRQYGEDLKQVYETANRYHFIHTLALLGVPLCKRPLLAGSLLAMGTLVFSGTCYYYALTGSRNVRQYTPYGGMMLIGGWLAMVL